MADWAPALELLPHRLAAHVGLSAAALGLALAISVPLVLAMRRSPRAAAPVLGIASLIQTIPALALLALFYPLLVVLRTASGVDVPVLGFLPALLALTLYALLPLLRGAMTGLRGIDPAVTEAADAIGMTPTQKFTGVELPLAAPVMMAGLRTAAVWTIGAATLATPIGATSLGDFIFVGLQTEDWIGVAVGCLGAAGLAIAVDALLGLIEHGLSHRSRARIFAGLAGLGLIAVAALVAARPAGDHRTIVVGAKSFSEQYILAEVIAARLAQAGYRTEIRSGLGSAVAFRALKAGDIDVYVDYSGTLATTVLDRADDPPLAELSRDLTARTGVGVVGPLGFENAYVLAMRGDEAAKLGVRDLADLARVAPRLTLGGDIEFQTRPEWRAVQAAYGMRFRKARTYEPTFMYRALASGEADVISAFSSDGRVAAQRLAVLADPKSAIPAYEAVLLIAPDKRADAAFIAALKPLIGSIGVERMRAANLMVDRDADKRSPADAAAWLSSRAGAR
ncbi:ABC transporter permease/substrate-binding protein [Glacieibacterium frigidum]|uniref:ABC transporter permease subunit n=1 Tax=Glacieibacterium frigidum TaxID=2593303 RepID=A0A552UF99_9SPHN|nr:ABC transporter permease/substrate-binding protein [Glacieibacterium frigidum]TRW16871.1 ABC transporter permease subunit [Glacieibacterium frigidum]